MSVLMRYFGFPHRALERWLNDDVPFFAWPGSQTALPPVNVYENGDSVVMAFEVPGVAKENIDLTTTDTSVTIKVERPVVGDIPPEKYHVRERWRGEFGRTVTIPSKVDSAAATARYANGILTVAMPKTDQARSKQIEVKAG